MDIERPKLVRREVVIETSTEDLVDTTDLALCVDRSVALFRFDPSILTESGASLPETLASPRIELETADYRRLFARSHHGCFFVLNAPRLRDACELKWTRTFGQPDGLPKR